MQGKCILGHVCCHTGVLRPLLVLKPNIHSSLSACHLYSPFLSKSIGSILMVLALGLPHSRSAPPPAPGLESLLITEFVATGNTSLVDEDGDTPDWLEIHNAGMATTDLDGWFLTDDPGELDKWRFPSTPLQAGGFLILFASNKDRAVSAEELHTNFELDGDGEFLALVRPDGLTLAHAFAPTYPNQVAGLSYGVSFAVQTTTLLQGAVPLQWLVPSDTSGLATNWAEANFDDTSWNSGQSGIGFDAGGGGAGGGGPMASNVALGRPTTQSSTLSGYPSSAAVNGDLGDFTHTAAGSGLPATWEADLGDIYFIERILLHNRSSCCGSRLRDITVMILDATGTQTLYQSPLLNAENGLGAFPGGPSLLTVDLVGLTGSTVGGTKVRVVRTPDPDLSGTGGQGNTDEADVLSLGEVEVFGTLVPPGLDSEITTDIEGAMLGTHASAFIRVPFVFIEEEAPPIDLFTLRMKYDDGFVAYLYGVEVARRNAPLTPLWNASATAEHPDLQALNFEDIDITAFSGLLLDGVNVLALHGLNLSAADDDFLIAPELLLRAVDITDNRYFPSPTPGGFNSDFYFGLVADTKFNPDRGFYETPIGVTITNATPGALIRYTLDGSVPDLNNGFDHAGPIQIDKTTILRAAAFLTGWRPSNVDTHSYFFLDDVIRQTSASTIAAGFPSTWGGTAPDYGMDPEVIGQNGTDQYGGKYAATIRNDLRSLPTLSIALNIDDMFGANGIYTQSGSRGLNWERAASAEMILPDGSTAFQENCGIRIQGGAFRSHGLTKKHSLRLLFKSLYGASKLTYPIFGDEASTSIDTVVFRANSNDGWQWSAAGDSPLYIRDSFGRRVLLENGGVGSHENFVHLYINGHYWGLYNPVERPDHSFSATYFGGDKENWDAQNSGTANNGDLVAWNAMLAQANAGLASTANYQRIQGNNPDGSRNPAFPNYLDVTNLADYMIVNLYVGNTDWPHKNFWVGRDRSPESTGFKFYMWDSEWSMLINSALNVDRTTVGNGVAQAYAACRANEEFRVLFGDRLHRFFFNGGPLYVDPDHPGWDPAHPERNWPAAIFAGLADRIDRAIVAESARWGDQHAATPYTRDEHWEVERDQLLETYLPFRSAIVLNQFRGIGLYPGIQAPELNQFGGKVAANFPITLSHANPSGVIYYTLDGTDPRLVGGGLSPMAIPYTQSILVDGNVFVRARVFSGATWSARVDAHFTSDVNFDALIITEIMYHPPAIDLIDGDEFEFLELKNIGATPIGLSGLSLTGVTFVFTNGTRLDPGAFIVLARNAVEFQAKYPGVPLHGVYTGSLNNAGETIGLTHTLAGKVISIQYDSKAPWPVTPNALGFSLVPVDPNAPGNSNLDTDWRASSLLGGSPGADDPGSLIPHIVINEILTRASGSGDQVELHNPGPAPIDLGGWYLSDSTVTAKKFQIPPGVMIGAGGFRVFDESQFNPVPGVEPSFALASGGERVFLYSGQAEGALTGYSHGFEFGASAFDVSFGRHVISTGEERFPPQQSVTLLAGNSGPRVGPVVISEIHYHPVAGEDEFVEVRNITGQPVPLFETGDISNAWRLNGAGFLFPSGVTMDSNETIVLTSLPPADFRTKYNVPGAIRLFGPYAGGLMDSGERLELQRPETTTNGVVYITVDEVRYNDKLPWPTAADGSGPSLQRRVHGEYGDDPANWMAAVRTAGQTLPMVSAPIITQQPRDLALVAYQDAMFSVTASGSGPLLYQWRHEGEPIDGATNALLLLPRVEPSQAGVYDVVVYNPGGTVVSDPVLLTTFIPANILTHPLPVRVSEGASATFSVSATSSSAISYQWRFNGVNIPGATGSQFTITDVRAEDDGFYDVLLSDAVGVVASLPARLTVLINPVVVAPPVNITAVQGETVVMSIETAGTLPMTYRWRRAFATLDIITLHSHVSFLTLTNVQPAQAGSYTVVLTNAAFFTPGVLSSAGILTILDDADGDGMPDDWESAHSLGFEDPSDADLDSDGDGKSNREEYVSRTDPRDADSYLRMEEATVDGVGAIRVRFGAVSNRTYTVEYTEQLSAPVWQKLRDVVARPFDHVAEVTDTNGVPQRVYRLVTPRQP